MRFISLLPSGCHDADYQRVHVAAEHILLVKHNTTNQFGREFAEVVLVNGKSITVQSSIEKLLAQLTLASENPCHALLRKMLNAGWSHHIPEEVRGEMDALLNKGDASHG